MTARKFCIFPPISFPATRARADCREIGTGAGKGYTINVPLPKGREDRDYAAVLHFLLTPVAEQFQPDMILVALGFDLSPGTPWGR